MSGTRNSWGVKYSAICYYESALSGNSLVRNVERTRDIMFQVTRNCGVIDVILMLTQYELSLADLYRARSEFPDVTVVVNVGEWNNICVGREEAKRLTGLLVLTGNEYLRKLHSPDGNL